MRLLIASDLHGSPEAAAFLRRRCEELSPDMLVLLGDYLYHGPRNPLPSNYGPPDVVSVFSDLTTPVVAVRGNCDAEVDLMLLPFAVEDSAVIAADGLRIVAQHGHHLPSRPPIPGVRPGDVVLFPPCIKLWHRAAPGVATFHISVAGEEGGNNVEWLEK